MCPSLCCARNLTTVTTVYRFTRAAALMVAGMLVAVQGVAAQDLGELASAAREQFVPISDQQMADAHDDLAHRTRELDRYFRRNRKSARKWRDDLEWDDFKKQLSSDDPLELRTLVSVYRRLNTNQPGLEAPAFRSVSDALRRYIDLAAAAAMTDPAQAQAEQIDALVRDLEQYRAAPGPPRDLSIGQRLDFIASLGQAPEFVAAVRREFARPNFLADISSSLLEAGIARPVDREEEVPDNILGVSLRCQTHTVGTVSVRTVPSEDQAVLEITSVGHIESQNRGTKGPAVIRSSSQTDYSASKQLEFSDVAFVAHPTEVEADLESDVHSIGKKGGGFGRRMVSKAGWKRARQNKGRAEAIATDHAKDRVRERMDDEAGESVDHARQRYEDEYRMPLVRVSGLPDHIRFSTTGDELAVEITQASRGQLGAPGPAPPLPSGRDAVVRIHETAINNYAALVLGGATAEESQPGQKAKFDVQLPGWMDKLLEDREDGSADGDEPFKPWSITLRRNRPLTVSFADGQVKLTIHLARLTSGEETFTRWDVTGTFSPELNAGGVVLHREGDLVVLPTDFDPGHDQLSAGQVALRSNLTKVLNERSAQGRGFSQTIEVGPLEPAGEFEKVGLLALEEFTSGDGWLTLVWNRQ